MGGRPPCRPGAITPAHLADGEPTALDAYGVYGTILYALSTRPLYDERCGRRRGLAGASYGNIITSAGNNNGNINAGDGQITLNAYYNQVIAGNIEHALHVYAGCFRATVPGRYPGTYAGPCNDGGGVPVGSHIWLDLTRAQIDTLSASDPTIIPPHMRVFAYALHEHGAFMLDTGNGFKWITQFTLEDGLPCFTSGGCTTKSYWQDWFYANGGSGPTADGNLKISTPIDWSRLTTHVHVLQECYVRGTCSDSIPEGAVGLPAPTNLRLISITP